MARGKGGQGYYNDDDFDDGWDDWEEDYYEVSVQLIVYHDSFLTPCRCAQVVQTSGAQQERTHASLHGGRASA